MILYYRLHVGADAPTQKPGKSGLATREAMATEHLIDNPGSDYNTFEPPPYSGPEGNNPRTDQYHAAPPSCKLSRLSEMFFAGVFHKL